MCKQYTTSEKLAIIEERFRTVTGLKGDLSRFPLKKEDKLNFETDQEKSRLHAEVFTPPYMVDEMLQTVPAEDLTPSTLNLDLCAGHGQFSIRLLRKLYSENGDSLNIGTYLKQKHYFSELQVSSCYKLLWIFSEHINLAVGDALHLGKLPKGWRGVWMYLEAIDSWVDTTGFVKALRKRTMSRSPQYKVEEEKQFVRIFESFVARLTHTCKEYKMEMKKIVCTKEGRKLFLEFASKAADGIEANWQSVATPEWVVREMVRAVPDVTKLKKILVLFNIEFLECLIHEMKVKPSRIEFGYDSELEGEFAQSYYKVHTFSVGKSFDELVASTEGKAGYDVVFSNPPYQVQSDAQKENDKNTAVAQPIYHKIVVYSIDVLKPQYICMITPSRWMAGGKGLNEYRARMLADKHIRLIQDFLGSATVFQDAYINGGVSYFLWDRDYNNGCAFNGIQRDIGEFDVLVRDNTAHQIIKKVLAKHTGTFCDSRVLPSKPFGLATNFKDWVLEGTPGAVKCYCPTRKGGEKWVSPEVIEDKHGVLAKWKVYTPTAVPGADSFRLDQRVIVYHAFVGDKVSVCVETYIVAGSFNTKKEAEYYSAYMKTKFYRFCLMQRLISHRVTKEKFSWVPDLGDYSKAWTDEELYEHFGLTKREIDHIDKTLKSLN